MCVVENTPLAYNTFEFPAFYAKTPSAPSTRVKRAQHISFALYLIVCTPRIVPKHGVMDFDGPLRRRKSKKNREELPTTPKTTRGARKLPDHNKNE